MNQQPWEFYVVTNKSTLRQISEASPYAGMTADAPAAFILCYRKTGLTLPMAEARGFLVR
jgi:nitroreductase